MFFFLFAFGDLLNCLADRDLDAVYKPHLTEAVQGIGVRGVIAQAVFSAIAAVVLTAHLSWLLNRWLLIPGVLLGLALAWAYSVEPVRLKSRGVWQLAFYWIGLFTGPMLFTTLLFVQWPNWETVLVCVAFGMAQTGVILLNTAEDFPEDRHSGIVTVVVALGLKRGMRLALCMTTVGGVLLIGAFARLCNSMEFVHALLVITPLTLALTAAVVVLLRLVLKLRRLDEIEAIDVIRQAARFSPVWITANAVTALLAAVCVFSLRE